MKKILSKLVIVVIFTLVTRPYAFALEKGQVASPKRGYVPSDAGTRLQLTVRDLAGIFYLGPWPKSFVGLKNSWLSIENDPRKPATIKQFPPSHPVVTEDGFVVTKIDVRTLDPNGPYDDKINFVVMYVSVEPCMNIEGVRSWFGSSPVELGKISAHDLTQKKSVKFWDEDRLFRAVADAESGCVQTLTVKEKPPYFRELPETSEKFYRSKREK